jgi:hypothetical protein
MTEITKKEKQLDWACRILMTIDLLLVVSGYLSWYQTKQQLVSPLIPRSTIAEVWLDNGDLLAKASMISAVLFLPGLWLYSFKKKIPALVFFAAVPVYFYLLKEI